MSERTIPKVIFDSLLKYAKEGNAECQNYIGYYILEGEVPEDVEINEDPVELIRQSAEKGWPAGQYNLGLLYEQGLYVDEDGAKAFEWYLKAAKQGSVEGMTSVGMCYYNGIGVTPDLDKALSWLNKAAEEKDARAQLLLAEIYAKDNRCKDKDKALFWFCEVAKHDMIRDAELKKFVLVPPYYDQVPPQPQLWYKVVLHFSDIDMLCIFPLKDQHVQILHDEVEKLRETDELTDDEIKTGVYGEGVVDCIEWKGYVSLYTTTQMRYEYPVSIDLEHPLTRNELDFYPPAPDPLTEEGFQKLLEKAKQGDVIAMSQVADCYKCGNGTERNKEQMIYWGNKYLDSINNR